MWRPFSWGQVNGQGRAQKRPQSGTTARFEGVGGQMYQTGSLHAHAVCTAAGV
ncbi:MAG: hypothetical protein J6P55_09460 [Bacteroidaceae bacterium]|nr:hypothetical protein [Bacteroidaceae bacterium]